MVPIEPVALRHAVLTRRFAGRRLSAQARSVLRSLRFFRGYLPADLLALVYLGVSSVVLLVGREHLGDWPAHLGVHLALLAAVLCLRLVPPPRNRVLRLIRISYPLLLMSFAYRELGVLNRLLTQRYFDPLVEGWDQALFTLHPHVELHRWVPFSFVSEFLHFSYLSYMLLIVLLGLTLFFTRRYAALRVYVTTVMLVQYACYVVFIFFPVEGPWYTFAHPAVSGTIFPSLVHSYLAKGAAVGTAFPSSHVAGSLTVAAMAVRYSKRLSALFVLLAIGIFFGTVYGGFHYGIDAVAGLGVGVTACLLGPRLHASLLRLCRAPRILAAAAAPELADIEAPARERGRMGARGRSKTASGARR